MIPYWPTSISQNILISYSGSVQDSRASFETLGAPITRPRTTAVMGVFSVSPIPMGRADFDTFEQWVSDDLRGGALDFCLRDPLKGDPRLWKIVSGETLYQFNMVSIELVQVRLSLVRLPSRPWFASYVQDGNSRVPDFVADYGQDIYGIDGEKRPASALSSIEGAYLTITSDGTSETSTTQTLTAGDIPATAPAGVTSIIGFRV